MNITDSIYDILMHYLELEDLYADQTQIINVELREKRTKGSTMLFYI